VDVCQAVQHAHQKGIIHRDLKPSNVMITLHDGIPVVKVIDFGVAKAVGQQLTDRTIYTALTQLVGTPLYMSPEQAEMSGLDVDTRSDVYSLGVLLYELLTGQTPFDKETLSKAGLDEMRRIIREDEPLRPSRRFSTLNVQAISTASQHRGVDERRLSKILSGELDWIVMKSLEKDRGRRYESASAFATDIQRYLSDEPVLACPPTTMYRFQKLARKHKPALATAAAIALCLFLGTTVSAWQAVRATTAEAQASANEQKAVANAAQAQAKTQEVTEQRNEAQRQRDEVKSLNEKLKATQGELRSTLYAAHMRLAQHAWRSRDPQQVSELLAQYRPNADETDLRGFEWHYLNRLCNSELFTLKGHTGRVGEVTYSPDGRRLATSSLRRDGGQKQAEIKIWDTHTGKELFTYELKDAAIWGLTFSSDGKRLAGAGNGVKVWDTETGRELLSLAGGGWKPAFSSDGKQLASGSKDKTVEIFDSQTGTRVLSLVGHSEVVASVAYSQDGQRLASASYDGTVKIWNAQSGQELLSLSENTYSNDPSVKFSLDGKLLTACGGPRTKVWNAETGQLVQTVNDAYADSVAFSPDSMYLITCGGRGRVSRVWNLQTGKQIRAIVGPAGYVALSPDGNRLASGSENTTVKIWDVHKDQECVTVPADGGRFAFTHDWSGLASVSGDNTVKIRDAKNGRVIVSLLRAHAIPIRIVAYSRDGKRLAAGCGGREGGSVVGRDDESEVVIWDTQSGQELHSFPMSKGAVFAVAFSPDGTRLAAASQAPPRANAMLKVWDVQSGTEVFSLEGEQALASSLAYSPDGKRLVSSNRVMDADSGQELFPLKARYRSVAYSADGKHLVTGGGGDGNVKLLDALTGWEVQTLKSGRNRSGQSIFSPDGKRIVTLGSDSKVILLDAATGLEVLSLDASSSNFNQTVIFSPDGNRLACNGPDGTVKIYDATPLPEKP